MRGARKPSRRCLAGFGMALAILLGAEAAAQEGGFEAAGWTGGPERSAVSGAFTRCAMSLVYGGGESLRLILSPEGGLGIDLAGSDRWSADSAAGGVGIALDELNLGDYEPEGPGGGDLSIRLPFSATVVDRLWLASQLHIRLADKTMNFPLPGIDRALPLLLQCLGRALAPRMGPYGPFAAPAAADAGQAGGGGGGAGDQATPARRRQSGTP